MENYFKYTPASVLYNKVKKELFQNKENYVNKKKEKEKEKEKKKKKKKSNINILTGFLLTLLIFIGIIFVISLFVIDILGIIKAFKCNYTLIGIISILGIFFGFPGGLIFYGWYKYKTKFDPPFICYSN